MINPTKVMELIDPQGTKINYIYQTEDSLCILSIPNTSDAMAQIHLGDFRSLINQLSIMSKSH